MRSPISRDTPSRSRARGQASPSWPPGVYVEEKVTLAEEAGAGGAVIHNTTALGLGGDPQALIVMPGTGPVGIPVVFVSESTGLALAGADAVALR